MKKAIYAVLISAFLTTSAYAQNASGAAGGMGHGSAGGSAGGASGGNGGSSGGASGGNSSGPSMAWFERGPQNIEQTDPSRVLTAESSDKQ